MNAYTALVMRASESDIYGADSDRKDIELVDLTKMCTKIYATDLKFRVEATSRSGGLSEATTIKVVLSSSPAIKQNPWHQCLNYNYGKIGDTCKHKNCLPTIRAVFDLTIH